jgi:hypothetical protein
MVQQLTGHDPRCERSTANRCRCACRGRDHGTKAPGIVGRLARNRRDGVLPSITAAELITADDSVLMALAAARRDAALAEGVPL